jgi:segregation and condensation protein B
MSIQSKTESILFVASKPVSTRELAGALKCKEDEVKIALEELKSKYNHDQSGLRILVIDDKVQMATNPDNVEVVDKFIKEEAMGELTRPQLETLTVIAYRGPITRPELEQIRGVNCAIILRNLLIRGLIEEADGKLLPVYSLSMEALRHLGVNSVSELADYENLSKHEFIEKVLENS